MGLKEKLLAMFFGSSHISSSQVESAVDHTRDSLSRWARQTQEVVKTPATVEEIQMMEGWQQLVRRATKQYEYNSDVVTAQMAEAQRNKAKISDLTVGQRMRKITKKSE